jgi:hypothetical protein
MDLIVNLAKDDPMLENALFNCVSAHKSFKEIFKEMKIARLVMKVFVMLCLSVFRKILKLHVFKREN